MTKILLITLEYPPQKGGVASYYFGLVEELKRHGFEVEVISNSPTPPNPPSGRGGKSEVLLYRWFWPRWIRAYFVVKRAIKKIQPDLIFVGQVLPLGTVAYLLRKKVSYVVFTHGMDVLSAQKSWRKKLLMKKVLESAKLVVANSEFTKQQIKKLEIRNCLPAEALAQAGKLEIEPVVLYPCPNIMPDIKQEEVELLRRRLGLGGKKVLLTLGRVVERKGQDLVLRALPEILKHIPNVVYVVAGAGPYLEELQKLVIDPHPSPLPEVEGSRRQGEGVGSCVRFVGEVLDKERGAYFAMSDLFIMPGRQIGADVEGFGAVFLEAALFGKPSIGGQSGGMPEAILNGKTGIIVDPNNIEEFALAVVQLLHNNELLQTLGNNAQTRALNEFVWNKQVQKLLQSISSP